MRIRLFIICCCMIGIAAMATAQKQMDKPWCGYTGKSPWFSWYQQNRDQIALDRGIDTAWLYVPVTLHLVGDNAGNGYFPLEQSTRALCEMNEQFSDAHIRFYLKPGDPIRYLNNSGWYQHDYTAGGQMIDQNWLPGRLNIFVVDDPADNCGYSWKDAIVMGKGCSPSGNTTWAHETGHHLSLPHPFVGWEGFEWDYSEPAPEDINGYPVEKTDGSNCGFAGDGFCDTEPDYLQDRWTCNTDKRSNDVQIDPNGVAFRSDATLYMGYSLDECQARFTAEQIEAMRSNLHDEHVDYLQITQPLADIDDNASVQLLSPIDSQTVHYNNITLNWQAVPGANFYIVEVGLAPGLSPKFFTQTVYNSTSVNITGGVPNNRVLKWRVRAFGEWDVCHVNTNVQIGIFKTKNLTSTNDLESAILTELSPNPVAGGVPALLTVTSAESMDVKMTITDASGRVFENRNIRLGNGENRIELPTGNLEAGFYVINLHNEKGNFMKRLVVTN